MRRPFSLAIVMLPALASSCDSSKPILSGLESSSDGDRAELGPTDGRNFASGGNRSIAPSMIARVPCPEEPSGHEAALNAADRLYESADLPAALACAELAASFAPQAIEAHHLRGAALATMGHLAEAQVAFAMALALDPEDPETLAAVSDFYINVVSPRSRDQLLLGLEYARRGGQRAATRRRSDRQLRARLALLVGAGLNDLGSSDLAMASIDEALRLSPGWLEADHERGVALFNLCKFDQAKASFDRVVEAAPSDPYANYYAALIAERRGEKDVATRGFQVAREVAPAEYPKAVEISEAEFRAELERAVAELSKKDAEALSQVKLEVAALPSIEDLVAVDPPFSPTIAGLYRGLPIGSAPAALEAQTGNSAGSGGQGQFRTDNHNHSVGDKDGEIPPRAIVLYHRNLVRGARDRDELNTQIRRTLAHELGHARGLDEDDLRRLGLE